jgi:hypothetical protein
MLLRMVHNLVALRYRLPLIQQTDGEQLKHTRQLFYTILQAPCAFAPCVPSSTGHIHCRVSNSGVASGSPREHTVQ